MIKNQFYDKVPGCYCKYQMPPVIYSATTWKYIVTGLETPADHCPQYFPNGPRVPEDGGWKSPRLFQTP